VKWCLLAAKGPVSGLKWAGAQAMKLGFLRKPARDESPLVVSMTGVRLGDRVIFAGSSLPLLMPLAARTGLSGQVLAIGANAADLKARAERDGHLVESADVPPSDGSYDVVIVEASGDWASMLAPLLHAVRTGGRIVVVIGVRAQSPLAFLKSSGSRESEPAAVVDRLGRAGWHRARSIGGRDGLEFVEAVRT
jgi:hypothetical protein